MKTQKTKKELETILNNCLAWISEHIKDEKELKRVLIENIGLTEEEFSDFGFDLLEGPELIQKEIDLTQAGASQKLNKYLANGWMLRYHGLTLAVVEKFK